jgi:hypothetical protein
VTLLSGKVPALGEEQLFAAERRLLQSKAIRRMEAQRPRALPILILSFPHFPFSLLRLIELCSILHHNIQPNFINYTKKSYSEYTVAGQLTPSSPLNTLIEPRN